jgi:uncharacterized protein YdhG (YjbR/CyaY superfamily)
MKKPKNVDEYIKGAPKGTQAKLREVRAVIRSVAPKAAESISYMMPAYDKGQVCWFGYSKNHVGLYIRPPVVAQHKRDLAGYGTTKSAVHLPLGKKTPVALIRKLLKARMKINAESRKPEKYVHYHKDGSIWGKGKLVKGVMEGYWEWFRKDGVRMRSGHFRKGKQTGKWTTYDRKGKVLKVTDFG